VSSIGVSGQWRKSISRKQTEMDGQYDNMKNLRFYVYGLKLTATVLASFCEVRATSQKKRCARPAGGCRVAKCDGTGNYIRP
jgi:hypothetical protein